MAIKRNSTPAVLNVTPTKGDKVFDVINIIIMIILCVIIAYPLYYVILASITDPRVVNTGKLLFFPKLTVEMQMDRIPCISLIYVFNRCICGFSQLIQAVLAPSGNAEILRCFL